MINKILKLKILVFILVFGMMVNLGIMAQDSNLNGTWVINIAGSNTELTFNNGNYDQSSITSGVTVLMRGTYTTSGNSLTMIPRQVHGGSMGLEARWYSKDDFLSTMRRMLHGTGMGMEIFEMMFLEQTGTYSIRGNALTIAIPQVYTRR